jgi:hypothetical protein
MRELDEATLAELEKLEALPQATWDKDLVLFREFLERTLPPGQSEMHFALRFADDPEFCRLTMRAMLASIEAEHRKERAEREASRQRMERYAREQEEEARRLAEQALLRGRVWRLLKGLLAHIRAAWKA